MFQYNNLISAFVKFCQMARPLFAFLFDEVLQSDEKRNCRWARSGLLWFAIFKLFSTPSNIQTFKPPKLQVHSNPFKYSRIRILKFRKKSFSISKLSRFTLKVYAERSNIWAKCQHKCERMVRDNYSNGDWSFETHLKT